MSHACFGIVPFAGSEDELCGGSGTVSLTLEPVKRDWCEEPEINRGSNVRSAGGCSEHRTKLSKAKNSTFEQRSAERLLDVALIQILKRGRDLLQPLMRRLS